ncbi:MAG: gliding motility-associated C-terminal domain-containing protein [Bacteroidia bacterium]|nr:gliding motility-associated C-terminal domain-containing protein [Bacteroidia bacterium]
MKNIVFLLGLIFISASTLYGARPTVAASNFTYNNLQCNSVNLTWTSGNGSARIIVGRKGSAPDFVPQDNVEYTANPTFGLSTPYGAVNDNFIVYNAGGTNFVNVIGLQPGQVYYFHIYEHDNSGNATKYLQTSPPIETVVTTYTINLGFSIEILDSCQLGNKFVFTNTSTSTIPGITYLFNYGSDGTNSNAIDTHSFSGNGGYRDVFIIPQTNKTGCATSSKQTVKVFPKRVAFIDINTFNDTQCLDDNYFEIAATGLLMPFPIGVTYHWDFGDGTESFFAKAKKRYKQSGTFTVNLELGSSSYNKVTNCKDTLQFKLLVLPSPVGNISVNDTFQCLKNNKFQFDNPDNTLSYFKWYFGDEDSSDLQNTNHSYKDTGYYKVMHVAYASTGCKGRDTIDVKVLPNINSEYFGLDSFYCQSNAAVLLQPVVTGGYYFGYPVNNESFVPNTPGQYQLSHVIKDAYCADTTTYPFNVYKTPTPNLGNDTAICSIFSYVLNPNTTGTSYLWSTNEKTPTITVYGSGTYRVTVTEGKCPADDEIQVVFATAPKVNLGGDTMLCKGGGLWLNAAYPKSTYLWSTGSKDSMIYAYQPGKYQVTVTNPCGEAKDSVNLFFQNEFCDLFMANAFSPGNDLVNNIFLPRGRNITVTLFQIYNRWGELIFETDMDGVGWDGTFKGEYVQEGLYMWKLNYTTPSGPYLKKSNAAGQILLIR